MGCEQGFLLLADPETHCATILYNPRSKRITDTEIMQITFLTVTVRDILSCFFFYNIPDILFCFQLFSGPDATPELKHSKFMGLTLDHDGLIVIGKVVKHPINVFSLECSYFHSPIKSLYPVLFSF